MERLQQHAIVHDLDKKMVFLVGPRQAGKTWLAKQVASLFQHSLYLNYDQVQDREIIENQTWLDSVEFLVLDELHKMSNWKNYIKGVFDTKPANMRILVTGSASLDIYDQLGDSLAGRYYRHRLLPFSLAEINQVDAEVDLDRLLLRGGFPEPYLAKNPVEAERWRLQYVNSLLTTDVFQFDRVQNIRAIQLVFQMLRHRVGSPVSFQSLAEDVGVSAVTIRRYIEILEALFIIFRVTPYSKNIARSILKEPKIYFFDNGLVEGDEGVKLENLVAVSLLKYTYEQEDYQAQPYQLHYLRTKEGQEVDFALALNQKIDSVIEVKLSNHKISKGLAYFVKKYNFEAYQVVKNITKSYQNKSITVMPVKEFLLPLSGVLS